MEFKMRDLLKAKDIVAQSCGISTGDAARVIGLFNTGGASGVPEYDKISAILSGDVSAVPAACKVLGITTGGATGPGEAGLSDSKTGGASDSIKTGGGSAVKDIKTGDTAGGASVSSKKPTTSKKNATRKEKTSPSLSVKGVHGPRAEVIPAASGEVVQSDELPPGFGDRCCEWVEAFCNKHGIDSTHIKSQQWRSACMYVGENIKQSDVIRDRERERHNGGRVYSGAKLEKLLMLWAYLCGSYNQVPLVSDFINFSGCSRGFFYDYNGEGLSSTAIHLVQKARQIEEGGLGSAVVSGGGAAIGSMFLLKARHNYSETVTIQHASATTALGVSDLPLLESK